MMSARMAIRIRRFISGAPTNLSAREQPACESLIILKPGKDAGDPQAVCLHSNSVLKINFGHHVRNAAAELDDLNVIGMNRIGVQDRAIAKGRNQPGVVRPGRM